MKLSLSLRLFVSRRLFISRPLFVSCHPERSFALGLAQSKTESKDPYSHHYSLFDGRWQGHDFSRADIAPNNVAASAAEGSALERRGRGYTGSAQCHPNDERNCHPERSRCVCNANALAESRDPYSLNCARPGLRHVALLTALAAAVGLFLAASGPTDARTDARFKDLGHRMMCTCGCGQILLECNHVGCQSSDKMRNQLTAALDKGDNDDLILQGFVQEYGPTVIAAPTSTGFNKIAWIMPFVALAAGLVFVTWVVQAWKNRPEPALADGIQIPKGEDLNHFRAQARKETDV
jgi:cytochrome c-type biogenesis protein CcmH/NrfF